MLEGVAAEPLIVLGQGLDVLCGRRWPLARGADEAPFGPGAETPPPELAGRDPLLEAARVAIDRVRAMAELGTGPHRSGNVADCLGRPVTSRVPTRAKLIAKGMIWSPAHGDRAFTVPLFDEFLRRSAPGEDWRD